jgi:hypothetical protein
VATLPGIVGELKPQIFSIVLLPWGEIWNFGCLQWCDKCVIIIMMMIIMLPIKP